MLAVRTVKKHLDVFIEEVYRWIQSQHTYTIRFGIGMLMRYYLDENFQMEYPEIPVNVYDLGLIYKIDVSDNGEVVLDMTLTAPNCPAADFIMEDIRQKIESVEGVNSATINLVFEPEWDKDMMSEEAKLELGFL